VKVTTPSGRTATKATRGAGAIGPRGAAGRRSSAGVARGARGTAARTSRSGVASGPYGMARYSVRMTGAAGHRTRYVSRTTLTNRGAYVRRGFAHYNCFTSSWFGAHRVAWRPVGWRAATYWAGATWGALAAACSYPAEPMVYDYGSNVVYEDNLVYVDGEEVASAAQYTAQARNIAGKGRKTKTTTKEEWTALGVFGMVQGKEKDANDVFQLAVNKQGIIRGNYYHAVSDTNYKVYGSVNKKTQRAAWTVGKNKNTVYETGIGNLTKPETTVLVHFGKKRTQQWTLVRLDPPKGKKKTAEEE
jgi:hypothetical protein